MRRLVIRTLSNMTLLVFSSVIAYGIGEAIVRIFWPQPMLPRYVEDTPYGVRKNMSNLDIWHSSPDYRVNIRTNNNGVRSDRQIPYRKPPEVFRIVGLGDSFTLGYEVEVEDTYLFQLEQKLHRQGTRHVEVINLAVSGFGTAEELIALREEGFRYSPDLVLLGYFVNDIDNNVTSNLFALHGDTLTRASTEYLPATNLQRRLHAIPLYNFLAERSQLLNIFRNYLSYTIVKSLRARRTRAEEERLMAELEVADSRREPALQTNEMKLTARLLDEIVEECLRRNVKLALLNIPSIKSSERTVISNIPLQLMRHASNIIYIDAEEILHPFVGHREVQWERWHGHWRPWVHHLVASVLADSLMPHVSPRPLEQNTPAGRTVSGERRGTNPSRVSFEVR